MVRVKVCGITRLEDALACAEAGADMLGLNFYRKSSRFIEPEAAQGLAAALREALGPACPLLVGVFVNDNVSTVSRTLERAGIPFAQLSGDESGEMLNELRGVAFKVIRPRTAAEAMNDVDYFSRFAAPDERLPSLLLDAHQAGAYGGTGAEAAQEVALTVRDTTPRLMLAGGLTPENVGDKVRDVAPWGVDVASGVEVDGQPGVKDGDKVRQFIQAVQG